MAQDHPTQDTSQDERPRVPTLGTKIAMFIILGLIVTSPLLWMFGSGPLLRTISPLVCPDGSTLITRSDYAYDEGTQQETTFINFECAGNGRIVESNADIILFSACAGPFLLMLVWGLVSTYLRKRKAKSNSARRQKNHNSPPKRRMPL
jgi:hypothetical protein